MYAFASFFSLSFLLIKSICFILFLFHSLLALWSFSSVKSCLLHSFSPWSISLLKKKLVPLKANAFITVLPSVNNTDDILFFYQPHVNYMMMPHYLYHACVHLCHICFYMVSVLYWHRFFASVTFCSDYLRVNVINSFNCFNHVRPYTWNHHVYSLLIAQKHCGLLGIYRTSWKVFLSTVKPMVAKRDIMFKRQPLQL